MSTTCSEVTAAVRSQLASFAEKKRHSPHAHDHFVLKLDHEGGAQRPGASRKRNRPETLCARPTTDTSTQGTHMTLWSHARDALETICREDSELRETLVHNTTTLQARHCCLTSSTLVRSAEDENEDVPGNTLWSLLFTSPVCTLWAAHLTCLDLECNMIDDDGVRRLAKSVLPRLPRLLGLHLASNAISAAGVEALAAWTAKSSPDGVTVPLLEVLGLTNNPLLAVPEPGEAPCSHARLGAALAAVLLRWRGSIRRVHLNHVGLTPEGVVSMLAPLSLSEDGLVFPALDTLYMKQNKGLDKTSAEKHVRNHFDNSKSGDNILRFLELHVLLE